MAIWFLLYPKVINSFLALQEQDKFMEKKRHRNIEFGFRTY